MVYIMSKMMALFLKVGPSDFLNVNQVMSSISIILTMAPPVRYITPSFTFLLLSLSTDYMGIYHRLVSPTRIHMYIT
jgi:hypothetical protein